MIKIETKRFSKKLKKEKKRKKNEINDKIDYPTLQQF